MIKYDTSDLRAIYLYICQSLLYCIIINLVKMYLKHVFHTCFKHVLHTKPLTY